MTGQMLEELKRFKQLEVGADLAESGLDGIGSVCDR